MKFKIGDLVTAAYFIYDPFFDRTAVGIIKSLPGKGVYYDLEWVDKNKKRLTIFEEDELEYATKLSRYLAGDFDEV